MAALQTKVKQARTSEERRLDICGAVSPAGRRCNRGLRHPGEHRSEGPDTSYLAGMVFERWPRTRAVRKAAQ